MNSSEKDKEMWKAMKLECKVQNYEWGKHGSSSHVARLFSSISGNPAEEDVAYAELWMGTHQNAPSIIISDEDHNRISLKIWLQINPQALGDHVIQRWGIDLPFLFKVLSVGKALSIQAHPDKNLAKILHQTLPNIYKDSNHKPEMALALTEFEALCGFISAQELKDVIQTVPEIQSILGETEVNALLNVHLENQKENYAVKPLRTAFTKLMTISKEAVTDALLKLKARLTEEGKIRTLTPKERLVLRLESQYPSDIGVLSAFFFNYIKLRPGEALCLAANELHAYLFGECVECMATSDNVVRAGLTPKYRDVETLCSMLTYKQGPPEIMKGLPLNDFITRYSPPFEEFEVDLCTLPPGASVAFPSIQGPSIFLVLYGNGVITQRHGDDISNLYIQEGDVLFVPSGSQLEISSSVNENGNDIVACKQLLIYRAGVNSKEWSIVA